MFFLPRKIYEDAKMLDNPKITVVTEEFCNDSRNKHSSSKWKKLSINLFKSGYDLYVFESGYSKYLYIFNENQGLKVRVSNHPPVFTNPDRITYFSRKFGINALLVGPNGVSTETAYQLIKETL